VLLNAAGDRGKKAQNVFKNKEWMMLRIVAFNYTGIFENRNSCPWFLLRF
jgi:hypothetical protein